MLPSTPATRDLLTLDRLKGGEGNAPYFINVGRGDICPEDGLWEEAVVRGYLSGCLLDVFREEPLPPDSALWSCNGVTITPHVAALSFPGDVVAAFAENLALFMTSPALLRHKVDFNAGY